MENNALLIPLGILFSSFLGSWHCAGMCGPFAALSGSRGQLWHYHLGRLISYTTLGFLSGILSQKIFTAPSEWLRTLGAAALALILVMLGFQYFFNLNPSPLSHEKSGQIFQDIYRRIYRFKASRSSFAIGLLAGLLPCMWLYTYVVAAASSKSPWAGSLVMILFWLGGLPALSTISMMIRPSLQVANARKQKVAGLVLVSAGIYALISHFFFHS